VTIESREKLAKFVRNARGAMSYRAYGKIIGVSGTTVQAWEQQAYLPERDNLERLAESAGYSLQELLDYLKGKSLPDPAVSEIVRQIDVLPIKHVALIAKAATERLSIAACES
jgi:transcriptional regulator with XRE-family HTH domain